MPKFHITWTVIEHWSADVEAGHWLEAFDKAPRSIPRTLHNRHIANLSAEQTDEEPASREGNDA